jgi:hypothetical protein
MTIAACSTRAATGRCSTPSAASMPRPPPQPGSGCATPSASRRGPTPARGGRARPRMAGPCRRRTGPARPRTGRGGSALEPARDHAGRRPARRRARRGRGAAAGFGRRPSPAAPGGAAARPHRRRA